jgi:hypothetical protein
MISCSIRLSPRICGRSISIRRTWRVRGIGRTWCVSCSVGRSSVVGSSVSMSPGHVRFHRPRRIPTRSLTHRFAISSVCIATGSGSARIVPRPVLWNWSCRDHRLIQVVAASVRSKRCILILSRTTSQLVLDGCAICR